MKTDVIQNNFHSICQEHHHYFVTLKRKQTFLQFFIEQRATAVDQQKIENIKN